MSKSFDKHDYEVSKSNSAARITVLCVTNTKSNFAKLVITS